MTRKVTLSRSGKRPEGAFGGRNRKPLVTTDGQGQVDLTSFNPRLPDRKREEIPSHVGYDRDASDDVSSPSLFRAENAPMPLRRWLLAFVFLLMPLAVARADEPPGLGITFIDVEGGAATLIVTPA